MSEEITIWHNPRCSKSRQTLARIEAHGVSPRVVRYLEAPPSFEEIERVLVLLGLEPRALMRTKESEYRELGLADESRDEVLIQAMVDHPKLIERPVVIRGNVAVLGRPPEAVEALFD